MKLYKFRGCKNLKWTKEILETNKFHFADWRSLNDPMEGFFRYYQEQHSLDAIRQLVDGKDSYGVCCFSKFYRNPLMWTHYANNHKGICIEVDANIKRDDKVSLEPIDYCRRIPDLVSPSEQTLGAKEILSKKIKIWEYEREIRAFCDGKGNKLTVGKITRVILGVRIEDSMKTAVRDCARSSFLVVETKVNFNTNRIEIKSN